MHFQPYISCHLYLIFRSICHANNGKNPFRRKQKNKKENQYLILYWWTSASDMVYSQPLYQLCVTQITDKNQLFPSQWIGSFVMLTFFVQLPSVLLWDPNLTISPLNRNSINISKYKMMLLDLVSMCLLFKYIGANIINICITCLALYYYYAALL